MNNVEIKHFIQFQQWDFHQDIIFTYFNKYTDEYIGSFYFEITEKSTWLCAVYVDEKYRGHKIFNLMMSDMLEYNKKYLMSNITLKCRRNNFIYEKYVNLGFKFDKINCDTMFDELVYEFEHLKNTEIC